MGEYTESEMKVVVKIVNEILRGHINDLGRTIVDMEQRIMRMERAFDALGRRLEGSERHPEDEGWFD